MFKKDLATGEAGEAKARTFFKTAKGVKKVVDPSADMKPKEKREYQRVWGDFELHTDTTTHYIEVKTLTGMEKYGNVTLETWSDNGEVTGNKVLGWWDNGLGKYTHYVFYNKQKPSHSIIVRECELREYVEKNREKYREAPMLSNPRQRNKSMVLLVPYKEIMDNCTSAHYINLI